MPDMHELYEQRVLKERMEHLQPSLGLEAHVGVDYAVEQDSLVVMVMERGRMVFESKSGSCL